MRHDYKKLRQVSLCLQVHILASLFHCQFLRQLKLGMSPYVQYIHRLFQLLSVMLAKQTLLSSGFSLGEQPAWLVFGTALARVLALMRYL